MNPPYAYREIYEQFIDECAFFWVLRSIALDQPNYTREDVIEIEKRVEAQLDGLMTSIDLAWDLCEKALQVEEPGEVFTAAVIAFKSHDEDKIQIAVNAGFTNDAAFNGLVSALSWLPGKLVHPWIERFLTSKDLQHKHLALAACSDRQDNPAQYLNRIVEREDCRQQTALFICAIKICGELKRSEMIPLVTQALSSEQKDVKFWAIRSRILLGDKALVGELEPYIFNASNYQIEAINIAFRVLPVEKAKEWISRLSRSPLHKRIVIKSIAILGDPHAINWLIEVMKQPELSRLAGEAFYNISGFMIEENDLQQPANSVETSFIPNNDPDDENVAMDEDENLPWADAEKVNAYWKAHRKNFIPGKRHFLGQEISQQRIKYALMNAFQRQRHAAAMEMALMVADAPLINTRSWLSERG